MSGVIQNVNLNIRISKKLRDEFYKKYKGREASKAIRRLMEEDIEGGIAKDAKQENGAG